MLAGGCTDDELLKSASGGYGVDGAPLLQFEVEPYVVADSPDSRKSEPSGTPEPETEDEKVIQDFWLFQFDSNGTRLAANYYELAAGQTLNDLTARAYTDLAKGLPMTIFVVTNTHSSTWGNGAGFGTLEEVKSQKLPSPTFPIRAGRYVVDDTEREEKVQIPMCGQLDNVTVKDDGSTLVVVPVTRMYAKVKIKVDFQVPNMEIYSALVSNIPAYCRVTTEDKGVNADGEPNAVPLPENTTMLSRAFRQNETVTDATGEWMVIYVPENICGEVEGADKTQVPSIKVPAQALGVNIDAKYDGMRYTYTVYPGENNRNNFNIRRNRVYRVDIDVISATDQHQPSSNCFVLKENEVLKFEPYNRIEKGGDYNISTYLNPEVDELKIDKMEIIWQTKDCIGDNTNGDLVKLLGTDADGIHRKVYVKAGKEGNALIAARNSKKEIIWSWHIWVTNNEPDNLANAIVYTTYPWDESGIHGGLNAPRIVGYSVMPCNLGALAFRSDDQSDYCLPRGTRFDDTQIKTFGMVYQWGRKDPFPPMIYSTGTEDANGAFDYTDDYTEEHFANDNTTEVHKTSSYNDISYLFHSQMGSNVGTVKYAIQHPTVYISGTTTDKHYVYDLENNIHSENIPYFNFGDWLKESDDRLWGQAAESAKKLDIYDYVPRTWGNIVLGYNKVLKAHLYDNYGEKSIFDPCPTGWRVAPGDLWFGFTLSGYNPQPKDDRRHPLYDPKDPYAKLYSQVNYCDEESGSRPGMSMYMQAFGRGRTAYFPLQGQRLYDGVFLNTGLCGNYHTATCDIDKDREFRNRVNLLHLHRDMAKASNGYKDLALFKMFEYADKNPTYTAKSTAGPIRCVRDRK